MSRDTFIWTAQKETAARMIAEGVHTLFDIASAVGTSHDTLALWRRNPAFQQRVKELAQLIAGELNTYVSASRADTMQRSKEVTDGLWYVATTSKSGQARVAALNTLARIAGLLGANGRGGDVNVEVNNTINTDSAPRFVEVVEVPYETLVLRDRIGRREVE